MSNKREFFSAAGLLLLRLGLGGLMAVGHGWGKLQGFSEGSDSFPDPLGIGSTPSMALAVFAEFFCSVALILGLATRFAAVPLAITMAVAAFLHHAEDPWRAKELAVVYLAGFIVIALTGPGRYSVDHCLLRRKKKN